MGSSLSLGGSGSEDRWLQTSSLGKHKRGNLCGVNHPPVCAAPGGYEPEGGIAGVLSPPPREEEEGGRETHCSRWGS